MIHNEDCLDTMRRMAPDSVDLIITSPPYAGKRTDQYPAPAPDDYAGWWMERAKAMYRVLAPTGSLVVNIKEGTVNGERQAYVYELVFAMRKAGWRWVDEYIWYKTNPIPGRWVDRLKDGWERIYHFAVSPCPKFHPDAVRLEPSAKTKRVRARPSKYHRNDARELSSSGSGFSKKQTTMIMHDTVLPPNVIVCGVSTTRDHPAAFPPTIPRFFVKLLTDPGDMVYDPFMGSGTTAVAAKGLGRRWTGSEISAKYCGLIKGRLAPPAPSGGQEVLA